MIYFNLFKVNFMKPEYLVGKVKMFCVLAMISLFTAK